MRIFLILISIILPMQVFAEPNDSASATVQTTDATVTTLLATTPDDGVAIICECRITGRKNDGTESAGYTVTGAFRRAGATTTTVGTAVTATHEDVAGWDAILDSSGTDVRVRVTGVAATTIDWAAYCRTMSAP